MSNVIPFNGARLLGAVSRKLDRLDAEKAADLKSSAIELAQCIEELRSLARRVLPEEILVFALQELDQADQVIRTRVLQS